MDDYLIVISWDRWQIIKKNGEVVADGFASSREAHSELKSLLNRKELHALDIGL